MLKLLIACLTLGHFCYGNLVPLENEEERLQLLSTQIKKELEILQYPKLNWAQLKQRSDGKPIYDVVIVGAGQTGMTIALALRKEKIDNVIIFDENEEGLEGPWLTYARMERLRSEKYVIGPDCNVPSLTCQSWFEAKYGEEEWENLSCVTRLMWVDYLKWYRQNLNFPIVNRTQVGSLSWDAEENCFRVPIKKEGQEDLVYARKVVLATGFQGSGEWTVPNMIKEQLPETLYTSVYKTVKFDEMRGKKVGILGAGPCAFDAAILCYEQGAEEIHFLIRRPKIPERHAIMWGAFAGFLNHFPDLADEDKWKYATRISEMGQPPTTNGVARVLSFPNVNMHFNSAILNVEPQGEKVRVQTNLEVLEFDHLLVATGCMHDLKLRAELTHFVSDIALWKDRFNPPENQSFPSLLRMPYLGKNFEFTEKVPGTAPHLRSIYNCTSGSFLSEGYSIGTGLVGMKYSIQKIVYGIARDLFLEDKDYYYESLTNWSRGE